MSWLCLHCGSVLKNPEYSEDERNNGRWWNFCSNNKSDEKEMTISQVATQGKYERRKTIHFELDESVSSSFSGSKRGASSSILKVLLCTN